MSAFGWVMISDRPGTIVRWIGTLAILGGLLMLAQAIQFGAGDDHQVTAGICIVGGLLLRIEAAVGDGFHLAADRAEERQRQIGGA